MNIVIDRSKWRTGGNKKHQTGEGVTKLHNMFGFMCCLGFACNQAGVPTYEIGECLYPRNIVGWSHSDKHLKALVDAGLLNSNREQTEFADRAAGINDNETTTVQTKERKLTELCKKHGHTIEFVGEYK